MLSTVLTNDKTFRCLTNNLHLYSTLKKVRVRDKEPDAKVEKSTYSIHPYTH